MENFEYHNNTKILFGRDMEDRVGEELKRFGGKVLVHYGGETVKKIGVYERVIASLENAGLSCVELGGVKPNPLLSKVEEGIRLAREERVDSVLAVGGGSVIDSAKAIGVGVPYDGDVWDFYSGKALPEETLPVGVVLTIPGAGSESSFSSVITRDEGELKRPLNIDLSRPEFAVMNPEHSFSLSPYQTACGAFDAMTHIMERYFTNTRHVDAVDRQSEAALRGLAYHLPKALENPKDYDTRAELLWLCKIAHDDSLGVGRSGDFASHMITHEISGLYDETHGATLSIIYPAWMRYVYKRNIGRFVRFAREVWGVQGALDDDESVALEGIRRMEEFLKRVNLPVRFSELERKVDRFEEMAERCTASGSIGGMAPLEKEDVVKIYESAV